MSVGCQMVGFRDQGCEGARVAALKIPGAMKWQGYAVSIASIAEAEAEAGEVKAERRQ